jgi:hypothetical protein
VFGSGFSLSLLRISAFASFSFLFSRSSSRTGSEPISNEIQNSWEFIHDIWPSLAQTIPDQVMLQDELGLSLESYEHPLKQAFGAFLGCLIAGFVGYTSLLSGGFITLSFSGLLLIIVASVLTAKKENNNLIKASIWSMGIAFLSVGIVYFL